MTSGNVSTSREQHFSYPLRLRAQLQHTACCDFPPSEMQWSLTVLKGQAELPLECLRQLASQLSPLKHLKHMLCCCQTGRVYTSSVHARTARTSSQCTNMNLISLTGRCLLACLWMFSFTDRCFFICIWMLARFHLWPQPLGHSLCRATGNPDA